MHCAGSSNFSSNCKGSSLEQILAITSNDKAPNLQLNIDRLSVRAPTVNVLAVDGLMQLQVEKAGMISVPFEVPLDVKKAILVSHDLKERSGSIFRQSALSVTDSVCLEAYMCANMQEWQHR